MHKILIQIHILLVLLSVFKLSLQLYTKNINKILDGFESILKNGNKYTLVKNSNRVVGKN